jgi:hypothetical protein
MWIYISGSNLKQMAYAGGDWDMGNMGNRLWFRER